LWMEWANDASGDKPGLTPKTKLLKKKKDCVLTTVLMDKSFLR
jgi:hypothetical protein